MSYFRDYFSLISGHYIQGCPAWEEWNGGGEVVDPTLTPSRNSPFTHPSMAVPEKNPIVWKIIIWPSP